MGQCFLYGNGGVNPLAYDVVCQATAPAKKEGRIWIKSSVPIVGFNTGDKWSNAPVGRVAIPGKMGGSNPASSNATLEFVSKTMGGVFHHLVGTPETCLQVQGAAGSWKFADAYVCHSDTWVQFSYSWGVPLFDSGDQCTVRTNGWAAIQYGSSASSVGSVLTVSGANSMVTTKNPVDLQRWSKLKCKFVSVTSAANSGIGVSSNYPSAGATTQMATATAGSDNTATIDISNIKFGWVNLFQTASYATKFTVSRIWLE